MPDPTDNKRINSILLASKTFSIKLDLSNNNVELSREFTQLTGIEISKIENLDQFCHFLSKESAATWKKKIEKLRYGSKETFDCIIEVVNAKNEIYFFHARGALADQDSTFAEGLCFLQETKNMNASANEKLYKSVLEKSPMAIVRTDYDAKIQYVNPAFEEIIGYNEEELLNKSTKIFKSGYHTQKFYEDLWQTILSGQTWEGNMLNRKKNGEKYWERAIIAPYYDENENIKGFVKNAEDITQQVEMRRNLKEERNLFLSGPVLVFKWAPADSFIVKYVSPNVEDLLGYTANDLVNANPDFQEIMHPSDLPRILDELYSNLASPDVKYFSQHYRLKTKQGVYRHFNDYTTLERDSTGEVTGINGYLIDNTEYYKAQQKLKENEIRYRDVFETAGVGIIYTNKEGTILDTNKKFDELVGKSEPELHGKSAMDLMNKSLPNSVVKDLLPVLFHVLKGNRIDPTEISIGRQSYEIQSDYNPHLESNIGILRDITDKKNAELQLQKSEAQYRYLVDHINDGIVITNKYEQITFLNPAAEQILGFTSGKVDIESIKDMATPDSVLVIEEQEKKRLLGEISTYHIEIITIQNEKKNLEVNASPMYDDEGKYKGSFGVLRDITEKVRAEFEIKTAYSKLKTVNMKLQEHAHDLELAKKKAEESDRLKSAFLANISHEIRTPMNGIIGFAQLSMTRDLSHEKRDNYLQIVTDSTMQLESVVMDIIDLSKIESGESIFNKKTIDTKEIVHEIYEANLPAAQEKSLEFNLKTDGDICSLNTDKVRFRQVVKILIENAIKFTEEGTITVVAEAKSTEIVIAVTDTGIGIAPEHHEIIFEPFRQVEVAMKRRFGGTGLGLTIARKIARILGGDLKVDSRLGKGSTFYFTHPMS